MGKSLGALLANKHKKESKQREKSVKPTIRTLSFVHPRGPLIQCAFWHFKLSLVTMAYLRKRPSAKLKRPGAAAAAVVEPFMEPPRTLSWIDSRITDTEAPTERYRFDNKRICLKHSLWCLCLRLSLGRRHVRKLDTPYPFPRVPAELGIPGSKKGLESQSAVGLLSLETNPLPFSASEYRFKQCKAVLLFLQLELYTILFELKVFASLPILRAWAKVVLRRCGDLFGHEFCSERLSQKQEIMSMFSGIECARKAWDFIHNAAMELWGVTTGVKFTCAAAWLASLGFLLRSGDHC